MVIHPQVAAAGWAPPNPKTAPPLPPPLDHPLALDPTRMRLFGEDGRAISFPTDGSIFNIGRDPQNTVLLEEPSVSRHHAFGSWHDGQLYLMDKSSGGTFINGQRILNDCWTPVPDGAKVVMGNPGYKMNMGVGGSQTIMARLDELKPTADRHQLRMGDGSILSVPEDGTMIRVGRGFNCEIALHEGSVSRYHADVKYEMGKLMVRDVGSTYGTYISGGPYGQGQKLESQKWFEIPEGTRLQFGKDRSSTLAMEPKAPLLISFFGDSSTPDIGGFVEAQGKGFECALINANSPAMVRGVVARGSLVKDMALTALPALIAAEGVGGLGAMGYGAALLVGGSMAAGLGLVAAGAAVVGFGVWGVKELLLSMKSGYRRVKERLKGMSLKPSSWSHVQQNVINSGPSIKHFKNLITENMARYPSSRHVVFISGHGDQKGAAGLKYSQVGEVVKGADAIFLDACNGAQLEALAQLSGSARVVVASEHTVNGVGFPLSTMFGRGNFPENPRDLGAALVQAASRSMPAQSLVAVDVKAMKEELFPTLDKLGTWLNQAIDKGWGSRIKQAMAESVQPSNGIGGFGKKIDLGSFLAKVGDIRELNSPWLVNAQTALNRTILSMSGSGTVSFDAGGSKSLPKGFNDLLKRL